MVSPPSGGAVGFTGLQLLSRTTRGAGAGGAVLSLSPHFSRWTMTALRRLASCSVWFSSVSSLLGKVVMRTNSRAAMAGRAPTTNWRTSDTLREPRETAPSHKRKHGRSARLLAILCCTSVLCGTFFHKQASIHNYHL